MKRLIIGVFLLFLGLSGVSCGSSAYQKFGWRAEDYFDDPKVIALCKAIEAKKIEEIDKLVASGADVNAKGKDGMTPLLYAFPSGEKVFRLLLKHGADPNIKISSDMGTGKQFMFSGDSVMILCAKTKFENYLQLALEHGGDPNIEGWSGYTPLKWTIVNCNAKGVELLIKAGVDLDYIPTTGSCVGCTSLDESVSYNQFHITLMLLNAGANYKKIYGRNDTYCETVAHALAEKRKMFEMFGEDKKQDFNNVVDWLQERGVSVDRAAEQLDRWQAKRETMSLHECQVFNKNRKYYEYIEGADHAECESLQKQREDAGRPLQKF